MGWLLFRQLRPTFYLKIKTKAHSVFTFDFGLKLSSQLKLYFFNQGINIERFVQHVIRGANLF
jgi:hypothetical protein